MLNLLSGEEECQTAAADPGTGTQLRGQFKYTSHH